MKHVLDFGPWEKDITEHQVSRLASAELIVPCTNCSCTDEIVYHCVIADPDRAETLTNQILEETVH